MNAATELAIGTAFTDWWNWSDGEPSYQDAFKAGYEAALRAPPMRKATRDEKIVNPGFYEVRERK